MAGRVMPVTVTPTRSVSVPVSVPVTVPLAQDDSPPPQKMKMELGWREVEV